MTQIILGNRVFASYVFKAAPIGFVLVVLMQGLVAPAEDAAPGKQVLHGYMRPEFANAPIVGKLRDEAVLHMAIGLPLTNPSLLDSMLQQVYDPKSPNFHKFLTPVQFAQKFGASESDYQSLTKGTNRQMVPKNRFGN
jgi:Pro-kumamolisin, activation domain